MGRRVGIVGTGQTKFRSKRRDCSAPDLVYEATSSALADADLNLTDIDAIVFGLAPEALDGINSMDKWCADAAGARNKPFIRVHTGGATGSSVANAAVYHVASGMFDTVLAVAMERVGETPDAQTILNRIYDPVVASDFGLNIINHVAMETSRGMETYGFTEEHMAMISVKNHLNAFNNPYAHLRINITVEDVLKSPVVCWPLKLLDCCPRSDGACAIVFASEKKAKKMAPIPVWVNGMAALTDITVPGEVRGGQEQIRMTAARAYQMAGIDNPKEQIQVVECYAPFSSLELMYYETLGFCERKDVVKLVESGFGAMTGKVPFVPSGGVMCTNPIGATALIRIAEAAIQVMGKGDQRQVPDVTNALATGYGGSPGPGSASFVTAMVLGKK
ncbi:MAG: thiolase family protein [Dehalococcoidia bacterium]|nr:thiolase family protein [Dehalococcoidia bacterium]